MMQRMTCLLGNPGSQRLTLLWAFRALHVPIAPLIAPFVSITALSGRKYVPDVAGLLSTAVVTLYTSDLISSLPAGKRC